MFRDSHWNIRALFPVWRTNSVFTVFLITQLFCTPVSYAQQSPLTKDLVEILIQESWETLTHFYQEYAYPDNCGYEHLPLHTFPFGKARVWDYQYTRILDVMPPHPEYALDRIYAVRTGNVGPGNTYTMDELGHILRESGIWYPGVSIDAKMQLAKKYGIRLFLGVPYFRQAGLHLTGFSPVKMTKYRKIYRAQMQDALDNYRQLEKKYDISIIENPTTLWNAEQGEILELFFSRLADHYESFNAEFKAELGFDMPLMRQPSTPVEKARRSLFWRWVRGNMQEFIRLRMEEFHDVFQPAGFVQSVTHGEDLVDFERYGSMYQFPGPAARPMLSDRELVLRYWAGYIFRLWRDLTDRPIFASARINCQRVGPRSIPTPNAAKLWHSQAIRSGTVGFFHLVLDYSGMSADGEEYIGMNFDNPDYSALGKLRWKTMQEIASALKGVRPFDPPVSETGIFVSFDTGYIHGMPRIFSQYIELCKAGVWNGFVSDSEVLNASENLNDWKVLYVPVMDYSHREVVDALEQYVHRGGTLVSYDPHIWQYDMQGNTQAERRRKIFGVTTGASRKGRQIVKLNEQREQLVIEEGAFDISVQDAEVIGTYEDGNPAVTVRQSGKGKAVFFAAPLSDIYIRTGGEKEINTDGRYGFYKRMEKDHFIIDHSWIWDVTVDNVHQVTGRVPVDLPEIDEKYILSVEK